MNRGSCSGIQAWCHVFVFYRKSIRLVEVFNFTLPHCNKTDFIDTDIKRKKKKKEKIICTICIIKNSKRSITRYSVEQNKASRAMLFFFSGLSVDLQVIGYKVFSGFNKLTNHYISRSDWISILL